MTTSGSTWPPAKNWHETVLYTVSQGWGGLQNLSLIPGLVGAAPIQNIGAYGVELADSMDSLRFYDWATGDIRVMSAAECAFGYRDSLFKGALKGQGVIMSVTFRPHQAFPCFENELWSHPG